MESVYLVITNLTDDSLLIQDIRDGITDSKISRPGPVYIPANSTITLAFSSSVHLSDEGGVIRGYITNGFIDTVIQFGDAFLQAVSDAGRRWANYANLSDTLSLSAGVWTTMPNDSLGAQTDTSFLPDSIPTMYDPATSLIVLEHLDLGDTLGVRVNFTITPIENNASLELRLYFPSLGGFYLTKSLARLDSGAGIPYSRIEMFHFFIGSTDVRDVGCYVEIYCSSEALVVPFGYYIKAG